MHKLNKSTTSTCLDYIDIIDCPHLKNSTLTKRHMKTYQNSQSKHSYQRSCIAGEGGERNKDIREKVSIRGAHFVEKEKEKI